MRNAKDSDALAYVAALRHGKKRIWDCRCETCTAIKRLFALASSHVSLKRLSRRNTAPKDAK